MKKPIVGITLQIDHEENKYWSRPTYFNALLTCGVIPMLFPVTGDPEIVDQLTDMVDGIIFSGGFDVHPSLYGEEVQPYCRRISPPRDEFENLLVKAAIAKKKPSIGICRGIQVMNVMLGGTLYQDIASQREKYVVHSEGPVFEKMLHTVDIIEGTPLADIIPEKTINVNSVHHQAIKDIAPSLEAMAISEDGLIEAVYAPDHPFFVGVQWHPEGSFNVDENSRRIFKAFTDVVKEFAKNK